MRNFFIAFGLLLLLFSLANAEGNPVYTVQPGDTLWDIAKAHGISWQELAGLNRIQDPTKLQVGTRLRLPSSVNPRLVLSDGTIVEVTPEERELLARVVHAEARGESLEGQIAVAAVVLNRVRSPKFPNTIWEVLHQSGQFTPVEQGNLPQKAAASCLEAVDRALRGEDPTGGALFFYNPATTEAAEYWATKKVIKKIGNHNFTL